MSKITKERAELKSFITGFLSDPAHDNLSSRSMTAEVFRIALASLEAEPVAIRARWKDEGAGAGAGDWKYYDIAHRDSLMADESRDCELIYTAPPEPVTVPDAISTRQAIAKMENREPCDSINVAYKFGWNACRAAMLQGTAGNSPVIPDGWVACSERMPEDGEKVLTSFRGGMRTAFCKVVDVLGHKIFVDEVTIFNGVPADHWQPLPAAPREGS